MGLFYLLSGRQLYQQKPFVFIPLKVKTVLGVRSRSLKPVRPKPMEGLSKVAKSLVGRAKARAQQCRCIQVYCMRAIELPLKRVFILSL